MPRKSKDELKNVKENIIENDVTSNVTPKTGTTSTAKKASTKKGTKKETTKTAKTAVATKTKSSTDKKTVAKKKTSSTKTTSSKKNSTKKSTTAAKKATTKKASSSKKTTKSNKTTKTKKDNKTVTTVEYYDLPYRYNETTVRILAQTPTMLFIYWDISDKDRSTYVEKYGESFFNDTKPVLIITNKTMNYTFEVEVDDFANSWYLPVNDPNCDYSVELGRRPKNNIYNNSNKEYVNDKGKTVHYQALDNYIYVCTSNDMEMPNNRILFDKLGKSVFFKNIKTNYIEEQNISSLSFMKNIGKVYNIYEIYKEMYKDEIDLEELSSNNIKLNLSSSSSSTFM